MDDHIFLKNVIRRMPGCIYWKNADGIYLECNDLEATKILGAKSAEEVIGRTDYNFLCKEMADIVRETDIRIMRTGKSETMLETGTFPDGRKVMLLSSKSPLIDSTGNVIGVIGTSIDVTEAKKAEELEIQNKLNKSIIEEHEKFGEFTSQLAHDIVSPLMSLKSIAKACKELPEKQHTMLRDVIDSINNIAGALLSRYKIETQNSYAMQEQHILIPLALLEIVMQKIYQYNNKNIKFLYTYDPALNFTFIKCDKVGFSRMISNLLNNSVEALEDNPGVIDVSFRIDGSAAVIKIKDNGKGMPHETVQKIINGIHVSTTKSTGYGIGLGQIRDTLKRHNGTLFVESQENIGTTVSISFRQVPKPRWIADEIILKRGSHVIILDDDRSVHSAIESFLSHYLDDIKLKIFSNSKDLSDFLNTSSQSERENMYLVSDYDLREDTNGLEVILSNNMKTQSIIVTSVHNNKMVQDLINSAGIKMFPKQFLNESSIVIT